MLLLHKITMEKGILWNYKQIDLDEKSISKSLQRIDGTALKFVLMSLFIWFQIYYICQQMMEWCSSFIVNKNGVLKVFVTELHIWIVFQLEFKSLSGNRGQN